jgi:restriction system protein
LISDIDRIEGLSFLVQHIASLGSARVGELRAEWSTYVVSRSRYSAETSIKSLLRRRLINLESRGLITRVRGQLSATELGAEYARNQDQLGSDEIDELSDLMASIREYNRLQREHLQHRLSEMNPYAFEFLVRDLLEEMGYSDVSVTSQGGDFGVDVVATVEFGITTITEFVQVKRRTKTLGRKEVDQLRGALPYHGALRGTLITLGKFSSGCESAAIFPGAQPITLIDGEKLVDLLFKHEVAMKRRPVELHEVDESYFALAKDSPIEDEQDI